ncbi:hypothetical protein HZC09_05425 [Candidatus Micrarchaeota archaeon]|nr:hypothetical protein [Candidatus Micrarchaeota archaeon]
MACENNRTQSQLPQRIKRLPSPVAKQTPVQLVAVEKAKAMVERLEATGLPAVGTDESGWKRLVFQKTNRKASFVGKLQTNRKAP